MPLLPLTPAALAARIAAVAVPAATAAAGQGHGLRLAVEGPVAADATALADAVGAALTDLAVPVARVRGDEFLRARSLRLEHGPADPDAFFEGWYDLASLRREVLDPLGPGGTMRWLTGLRDPVTDRPLRRPRADAPPGAVAVVDGRFFARWEVADAVDLLVHLDVTPAARERRVPPDEHGRVLPAWEQYLQWYDPASCAAFVVRADRPSHPALVAERPVALAG